MSNGNSTGKNVLLGVLAVIGALALIVGGYLAVVALSAPVGVGNAIIQKNSSQNWTKAQARFEDMYASIVAADDTVNIAFTAQEANPDDKTLTEQYTGAQQHCVTAVQQYNAEARKFLAQDFRAADLPPQIDGFDPNTDCKEDK